MSNFCQYHLFVCTNQREGEEAAARPCCANYGASQILTYLKRRIKALGVSGVGKIRISRSGCLGRCEEGPVIVVYPEGV